MLCMLHIENIAIIQQADIVFDKGFNVLTGETGAGKSIVIDAISAILGERTYRDVIRTGAQKAFVSAIFQNVPNFSWFADNQVEYNKEELLIQREIFLDGKNLCRVNGRPVTVANLRKLGLQLINIHGQHDSQQLFDESYHLQYLDRFAQNEVLRDQFGASFLEVCRLKEEISHLSMDEAEKARRMEMLQYQIQEIEAAKLKPGEDEELEKRRKILQNSEKLVSGLEETLIALCGDESANGASSLLAEASRSLGYLARLDGSLAPMEAQLNDFLYGVQDIGESLKDLRNELAFSEEELEQLEARLDLLHKLRRKYGSTSDEMLAYLEKAREELDEIVFAEDKIAQLSQELESAMQAALKDADKLHKSRLEAAERLAEQVKEELAQLDMPKVRFVCQFTATPLSANGIDSVAFLMSANAGEALKPMNKVASGGELARIMLALKNVLAEQDAVGTLIFDEVDAGVSGHAAQKVAEKLASVAKRKQVLCVTHLPQIAAMADCHLLITKAERDGRTFTSVEPLDFEGRKKELARVIGGAIITPTTLKSAEELLRR